MDVTFLKTNNEFDIADPISGVRRMALAMIERSWLDLSLSCMEDRKTARKWFFDKRNYPYSYNWCLEVTGLDGVRDIILEQVAKAYGRKE